MDREKPDCRRHHVLRLSTWVSLVGLFLTLLVTSACSPTEPREARKPSIVLILVDQLRADAVERFMPKVQALGSKGVQFTSMRSAAPWTYPSVISMFSGLYPQQHGADGSPDKRKLLSRFSADIPLLPTILRESHYTAAFVTNPFLQRWNPFHRGFDHYAIDEFIGDQGARIGDVSVWTDYMFSDTVNAAVIEHFDRRDFGSGDKPEFTYVHYIDVHGPWEGAPFDVGGANHLETEDQAYGIAANYIDKRIAELYDYFMERYEGDVIFVVTSDHGQEFGNDLSPWHSVAPRRRKATVHDFNTRIPFLILPSKQIQKSRRIDSPCSNVDVTPTLLDWLGLRSPLDLPGSSLFPAIQGLETLPNNRSIYSVRNAFGQHNEALVIRGKKYMRYFDKETNGVRSEVVFDLANDPKELSIASKWFGSKGKRLNEASRTNGIEFPKVFEAPDEELKSKLQDIGYLGDD